MKLGSLFDGSGGFPLAAMLEGIEPVWASEIDPFCLKVTARNFPNVLQLGDITKINGGLVEPVDVVTFGSPCQDLSAAGNQEGLNGQKSKLFYEAIRIINEMREKTNETYPRYAVWENVPGALSSNKGQDFKAVLEAFAGCTIPKPAKWRTAGCIMGNGWSIAWRILDAQFCGVPQRRRRIFLVVDYRGHCAAEILFKRQGLLGDFTASQEAQKDSAGVARGGIEAASGFNQHIAATLDVSYYKGTGERNGNERQIILSGFNGWRSVTGTLEYAEDRAPCLQANMPSNVVFGICSDGSNSMLSDNPHSGIYEATTTRTLDANGGNPACNQGGMAIVTSVQQNADGEVRSSEIMHTLATNSNASGRNAPIIYDARGNGVGNISPTITGDHNNRITDYTALTVFTQQAYDEYLQSDKCGILKASGGSETLVSTIAPTLDASYNDKFGCDQFVQQWGGFMACHGVRRLIPLECCRLQGFPDWWVDRSDPKHRDSPEYRMWGNGVALPCVRYVMQGIQIAL